MATRPRDTEGTSCTIRRSLAAVLSVGTLFLATACAGDDLSSGSDNADESTSPSASTSESSETSAGGPVTSGWPELPRGRARRRDVPTAPGRTPATTRRPSWSTRATATWPTSPAASTSSPSTSAASSTSSTARRTATNAAPFEAGDGQELADAGKALLDEAGHHAARPVGGHRHQRLLGHQGLLRLQQRHQAVRPRGQVSRQAGGRPRLRGPARLRGRPHRPVRHRRHRGAPARLRQRPDLPVGDQRRVRSSARPAPPTAPWRPRGWWSSRTTSTSSRLRTSCRPSPRSSSAPTPTSPTSSTR